MTAWMHRHGLAFTVSFCDKYLFHMGWLICDEIVQKSRVCLIISRDIPIIEMGGALGVFGSKYRTLYKFEIFSHNRQTVLDKVLP